MSIVNSIRNPEGIWINTQAFREAGEKFKKYGYYCGDPWGSPAWMEHWTEERNRCIYGYSVGGSKITGNHYYYLNYCPIQKVDNKTGTVAEKIEGFPDFWDGDYNYFWIREIARLGILDSVYNNKKDESQVEAKEAVIELDSLHQALELKKLFAGLNLEVKIHVDNLNGGYNLIVGKSRRKGYSLKSAAVSSNNYFTRPRSLTVFAAYEKKYLYPNGLFTMAMNNINFVNQHTGWAMPMDEINKQDHVKASYIQYKNGIKTIKGFKSEIIALTFKDNADAGRGKDIRDLFFEESGAFGTPGLLKRSYKASEDCVQAGAIKTGMITLFGTSGDMSGGTADYSDMFSKPAAFGLLPFHNIWEDKSEHVMTGFFHPINWNMEGFYDNQGNSDKEGAKNLELEIRKDLVKNGATTIEIQQRMQEKPLGPSEAFSSVAFNNFPVVELKRHRQKMIDNEWQKKKGTPVELFYEKGEVKVNIILDGKANPVTSFDNVPKDKRGCVLIYEHPIHNAPKGLYKVGYDPVRQETGTSLAGIIVYKGVHRGSLSHSVIVAEYIGRLGSPENIDKISCMLAELYNTQTMYENEVIGVKTWYSRQKKLKFLAAQPDRVISKNVKNSGVRRIYGCHMNEPLKDGGERYVKQWLETVVDHDEDGKPILALERIPSLRLVEELIAYYRKGNFDLISALFMCMFQVQEESLDKVYEEKEGNKNVKDLLEMADEMYKNR